MRLFILLSVYFVCMLLVTGYIVSASPAFGWDALNYWLPVAHADLTAGDPMIFGNGTDAAYLNRHPRVLPWVIARVTEVATFFKLPVTAPLVLFLMSILLISWAGFLHLSLRSDGVTALVAMNAFIFSLPLFEQSILGWGGAEMSLTTILVTSVLLFMKYFFCNKTRFLIAGFFVGLTCVGLKNSGVIYSLAVIIPVLLILFRRAFEPGVFNLSTSQWLICLCLICLAFALLLIVSGFSILVSDRLYIAFPGYALPIAYNDVGLILKSVVVAFLQNLSFGIAVVFSFLVAVSPETKEGRILARQYHLLLLASFMVVALVPLFIFEKALFYAQPGGDTSFSRHMLPFVGAVFAVAFIRLSTSFSVDKGQA